MKKFISLCIAWCFCLTLWAGKHYTVIVSLDGFRWDYPKMYDTPFFDQMAREGVKATMIPSFPSKTFPNHYTMPRDWCPTTTASWPIHSGTRNAKSSTR